MSAAADAQPAPAEAVPAQPTEIVLAVAADGDADAVAGAAEADAADHVSDWAGNSGAAGDQPAGGSASGAASPATADAIRSAFVTGDAAASKALHAARAGTVAAAVEQHGGSGSEFVKSIVFGGLDGIITTFSIVAAVAGASLSVEVVLMMGFANLIADGISMGVGDFLSSKAELDYVRSELKRESWELTNHPEGEMAEMVELYEAKGVKEEDAKTILSTMVKYPDLFLDHMMHLELGQLVPDADESPAKEGLVTFFSFLGFGSIPMWTYLIMWGAHYEDKQGMFGVACATTAITMFALGAFQARITRQNVVRSGTLMMLNGSLAAAAAYLVGWGLEQAIGTGAESC